MGRKPDSEQFYDAMAAHYNEAIERCVPLYHVMLDTILHYVPDSLSPTRILELGCGGGNLTRRVLDRYPSADVLTVDFSAEMLRTVSHDAPPRLRPLRSDFRELSLAPQSLDLVVSSISIHHLEDADKAELFRRIHGWLRSGGAFCYSDQFAGESEATYRKHMLRWRKLARELGASPEEWNQWMRHQESHDHHSPLRAQLAWLEAAGFERIDCVWRHLLWTVVLAERA
jgi:tRNA (cmo5U34)-methyltransferase